MDQPADRELSGRVILITGGTTGLGLAMAEAIVAAGAMVVITARDADRGRAAAQGLGAGGVFLRQDALVEADWATTIDFVTGQFGRLDGLINNVGGSGTMAPIDEVLPARFAEISHLNIRSTLLGLKHGFEALGRNSSGGAIVNIASIASLYVHPLACAYCASKAVLPALSRAAAKEFAGRGVRVNSIYPGVFASELAERDFARKGNKEAFLAAVPLRRLGEPAELGPLAVYLLSDRSRGITGADFVVDGGKTIL